MDKQTIYNDAEVYAIIRRIKRHIRRLETENEKLKDTIKNLRSFPFPDIIETIDNETIIAVDFDGTLCENKYPEIGNPTPTLDYVKHLKEKGAKIILWTCRCGEQLNAALDFCLKNGLEFDMVNDNLPEHVAKYNNNCRKIYADYYIDDKNLFIT